MKRAILSSLILAGAALSASPAAAEECRCTAAVAAPETYAEPDVLAHIVCAASTDVDVTVGVESGATSQVGADETPPVGGEDLARPAPAPQPVPWCEGADDPRCMPGQGGPSGQGNLTPLAPGFPTAASVLDQALWRPVTFASVERTPRWGVRTRVERPPRS